MAKTSASFTIMDYTDGVSLITGIDSNLPLTCVYDKEAIGTKLNPSWAADTTHLELTPKVMKAGSSTSLVPSMENVAWKKRFAGGEWGDIKASDGETMSTLEKGAVLEVTQDQLLSSWQVEYKFTGVYNDPILKIPFNVEVVISFSRVANGTSFTIARAYAPDGNTFKNGLNPSQLTVKAELMRSKTGKDTTDITYKWQYYDTTAKNWADITSGKNGFTISKEEGVGLLTLTPESVTNFLLVHCIITDDDPLSDTTGQSFTTEGIAFYDVTDPYQAVIESTAGSVFKKGSTDSYTTTILICRVYQNGEEIDTKGDTSLTYSWSKTDKNGSADSTFTPKAVAVDGEGIVKTNSKAIEVYSTDVDVKATFFCEVN